MDKTFKTISPVDGRCYVERAYTDRAEVGRVLTRAHAAQRLWKQVPLHERLALMERFVQAIEANTDAIAEEITWQMGRPTRYTPGEVRGFAERARYMMAIAEDKLAPLSIPEKPNFTRYITREPLGVVLVLAPWNYPYLTAVNSIVPALLAGNTVMLKHSPQTPLCAERLAEASAAAGFPEGVFQYIHLDHPATEHLIATGDIDFVAFTGSVAGGEAVTRAAAERMVGIGLELGGKDPAYVRPDAELEPTVENLVDGAYFNSGQSCCAIERIYVHKHLYQPFVEAFVVLTNSYELGNPVEPETTLGPLVRTRLADMVRAHMQEAVDKGAQALIDPSLFTASQAGTPYLAPQVLIDVNHTMTVMQEETFGPVVGIMSVASDEEAIALMNDSVYGLAASVWTQDVQAAQQIGIQVEVGTWFMNRCDYLDPALAWTGVKRSGRGCTLSEVGYEHLTRPKSHHLRTTFG